MIVFVLAYAAAIPFMNTSLIEGPVAQAWHGADVAYFVNLVVAAVLYGGYRVIRGRASSSVGSIVVSMKSSIRSTTSAGPLDVGEVADAREHLQPASRPGGLRRVGVVDRE